MPRCPSCFVPLVRVEEGPGGNLKVFHCAECFGHWLAFIALQRRCRLDLEQAFSEVASEQSLQDLAEIVQTSHTKTELRCSQCEKPMGKGKFHPMIPVLIDRCARCNMVWLDAGEYSLIRLLHRELMTSDDPEILRRREKIAGAFVAWEGRDRTVSTPDRSLSARTHDMDDAFDLLSYVVRGFL